MGAEFLANPYPGLRPFEFPERHLFFGREGQSEELSRRLRQGRFLSVVGTSGSGKSSLVRAGLLPALYGGFMDQAGPRWRVALLRPGNEPIRNLAAALVRPADFGGRQEAPPKNLLEEALVESNLRVSSLGLLEYLRKANLPQDENLLIVVDQFEELFRFKKEGLRADADDEAAAFVKLLLEATRSEGSRVYVVITMRSDFLGDCAQFRGLPEAINEGQYLIPRMTREQQRPAIVAPAKVYGAELTTRLVNRLLNDIGDDQDQLPILQHALMRTWDEWKRRGTPAEPLDFTHYEAIGGMAEALSRHADEAYEELAEGTPRKIAERLFKSLTETDRDNREIRRRATIREVCAITKAPPEEVIPVVNTFRRAGRTFIMPPPDVTLDQDSLLDISHESLIRNWKRLDSWVKEEARAAQQYRRLAEAAEMHAAGELGYWRDPQLSFALKWKENEKPTPEWASRYHPAFSQAMRFLEESKAAQVTEQEREEQRQKAELERAYEYTKKLARTQRLLLYLVATLAGLLVFAIFATVYAYRQKRQADANAQIAIDSEMALRQTYSELRTEKENLATTKASLQTTYDKLAGNTRLLEIAQKGLEDSLRTAKAERKRAEISEAKTAASLVKQKELTDEANTAKDRAVKTLEREERNRSGLVFVEKGELNKARAQFASLLQDYTGDTKLTQDERIDGRWWASHNLGAIYGKLEDYDLAAQKYNEAIQILGDAKGERRRNLIATLRRLGQLYAESAKYRFNQSPFDLTQYVLAGETYKKLLALLEAEDTIKKDDPRYEAGVKREFADVLYILKQSEPAQALDEPKKLYQEALRIYETNQPKRNIPEMLNILSSLEEIAMRQNPADAEAVVLKALKVREEVAQLDPTHPDIAESYSDLAKVYRETGKQAQAAAYEELAGRIRDWTFRTDRINSFPPDKLDALAEAYRKVGRCDSALEVYNDTLNTIETNLLAGEIKDPSVRLKPLMSFARLHRDLGDNPKAKEYFREFVSVSNDISPEPRRIVDDLEEIALFYHRLGDYAQAEEIFRRLYELRKPLSKNAIGFLEIKKRLQTLDSLAVTLEAENKLAEAEGKYQEEITLINQELQGSPHTMTRPLLRLAKFYLAHGREAEAEQFFHKVLSTFNPQTGQGPSVLDDQSYYVLSLIELGRIEERKAGNAPNSPAALEYFKQALNALDKADSNNESNDPFATGTRYFGRLSEKTPQFYSDRADILEALARQSSGEEAANFSKQALEARQQAQRLTEQIQLAEKAGCTPQGDRQ